MNKINPINLKEITCIKNKNNHFNVFSSIIKRERLLQNMTLEETASGICSVSYLSKLENNQIEPKEEYVKFLFDRLAIDYSLVKSNDYENILKEIINLYFYYDFERIDAIIKTIDFSLFDCNAYLCKAIYLLINHLEEEAISLLLEVDKVRNCLSDYSAFVFGFLISDYYIKVNKYGEAYDCLSSIHLENNDDEILNYLISENTIVCAFNLRKYFEATRINNNIKKIMNLSFPETRRNKISIISDIILGLDDGSTKTNIYNFLITNHNIIDDNDNYYLAILGLCKLQMYSEVIDLVEKSGMYVRNNILALYGYAIYCLNLKNKFLTFLELIKHVNLVDIDNQDTKFIEFIKRFIENEDKVVLYEYLKFDVLVFCDIYPHALYDDCYYKSYLELLISLSKYKDATSLLKEQYSLR